MRRYVKMYHPRWRLLVAVVAFALAISGLWFALSASATSTQDRAGQAALSYAQQRLVWNSGPSVQSVHLVVLRKLRPALAASVPPSTAQNVNLDDLIHRYGANRLVALVVLHGVYNSLPPDEGVNVNGDIVVLTDARTDRILLVTD